MPDVRPGRHELGQNFLTDRSVLDRIVHLVSQRQGPLVEWGTGNGAVTVALAELGRPLEGVEIDSRRAAALRRRIGTHVCISEGDILRHAPPEDAVVVSNVPFHLTTPILRHLLASTTWRHAVLLTQWEVARKRAGIGGTTQLTAQWWPWFTFTLDRRVPSTAFRPRPNVDGGLLLIDRRPEPWLPESARRDFQSWVATVFSSRGRGATVILQRNGVPAHLAGQIAQRRRRSQAPVLPRDLRAEDWVEAYVAHRARA